MPTIAQLREKVILCRLLKTTDSELNRVETISPVLEVWAEVVVKGSTIDNTTATSRPELHYEITIRKQAITCDCIKWRDKVLYLTAPYYEKDNKYIVLRAEEIV